MKGSGIVKDDIVLDSNSNVTVKLSWSNLIELSSDTESPLIP